MTRNRNSMARLATVVGWLCGAVALLPTTVSAAPSPAPNVATAPVTLDNAGCLKCHDDDKKHRIEVPQADGKTKKLAAVNPARFGAGVHAKMQCVACHTNITDNQASHAKNATLKVDCGQCHRDLLAAARQAGTATNIARLETVVKNADAHAKSFHARPDKDNPTQPKATCEQCHDSHSFNVPTDRKSPEYDAWRQRVPALCGESCHDEQLETYSESVHGKELLEADNAEAAICIDCHTSHEITNTSLTAFKLLNPEECGNCHRKNLKTYRDTYHGQVTQLGYAHTAKCYDCHGSHEILRVDDKKSKVHPDNRLKTCKQCHDGKKLAEATAGFVSFGPHANAGDYERYPQVWIAARFMVALLIGVFAFFWLHCGLWYYREWQDRKAARARPMVRTDAMQLDHRRHGPQHVRRFALGWRIAHLVFALVTMTLILTGMTALYSETAWAPVVAKALGGANALGIIHRVCAVLFVGIFFAHFCYVMFHLLVLQRGQFKWFGPDSLLPRLQDFIDCYGMFKWFVGKGPRPLFDRWAYFEKFDYWAVFWGVNVIGFSGLMLAFPHVTASYLPGWVFNVATLVHGEEAFLAAVFLFTVHFFNNHFRPDKLPPPDIVMFTGTLSLDEFRRDHPAHFKRLSESGELAKYLVDAPSAPLRRGSKILGLTLIAAGLILLVLVGIGFAGSL